MESNHPPHHLWTRIPPWIFIGAVMVLLPLFGYMTYETIERQKKNSVQLLMEKGAALIRAFEAGTRTGVMGTQWNGFQLQRLLTETAQQPDIDYLLVTDIRGRIIAHNNPAQLGKTHGQRWDISQIIQSQSVLGREETLPNGQKVFEVTSRFMPSGPPIGMGMGHRELLERFQALLDGLKIAPSEAWIIFIGLNMQSVEKARKEDMEHAIIMGAILLLIGFSGIVFLFLAEGYRSARTSLSRIRAFSDHLVENMPIGIVALDHQMTVAMVNQAAASILQVSISDATGKKGSNLFPSPLDRQIERLSTTDRLIDEQIECLLADNRRLPLEVNASKLLDEGGTPFGYVLLLKDLSEVTALRRQVARSQRLATVGHLAAGVAHEIRNPLSSIKGFAVYFKERYGKQEEDRHIAEIMIQEVDKLNRVVGQLLEFARPIEVTKKWVPIRPLVDNALKLIEQRAQSEQIEIQTLYSPDLDAVFIDPDRINQVLLNLFLNAAEAMAEGGTLTVKAERGSSESELFIRIMDTGAGIAAEDIPHIFDPYFTTKPTGTGLGLAIVHNIIDAHEGNIRVESKQGSGTIFTLFLPQPGLPLAEET